MSSKLVIVFCVQAILAQVAFSQCIRSGGEYARVLATPFINSPCGYLGVNGLTYNSGNGLANLVDFGLGSSFSGIGATGGGAFPIESLAPIAPNGIAVTSENVYEGALGVVGELPFLSTVALEAVLPSAGAGIVNHGYGNGITAITSEINNADGVFGYGSRGFGLSGIGSAGFGLSGIGSAGFGLSGIGLNGIGSGILGYGSGIGAVSSGAGFGRIGGRVCDCGW